MESIKDKLFQLQDKSYWEMQIRILPNLKPDSIIGVRTPELRRLAKEYVKGDSSSFLKDLPHKYFEENQLHAFILSELKDYEDCITNLNQFLPYIDNWATCDQLSPKIFKKHSDELLEQIKIWISSKNTYTIRFGIGMLMQHFLDDDFKPVYLKWVSKVRSNEYYVNMMIAWYFATALAKQYETTIPYLENNLLDTWTHNKTIQKAIESFRVSLEHKEYLRTLKRK